MRTISAIKAIRSPGVKLIRTLSGHTAPIASLAWSRNGEVLATASADQTVILWDIATGDRLKTLQAPGVNSLLFHESKDVLFGLCDSELRAWNAKGVPQIRNFTFEKQSGSNLVFDPDGLLIVPSDKIYAWDFATGAVKYEIPTSAASVAVERNRGLLATLTELHKGQIEIWDLKTRTRERVIEHNHAIYGIAFSPDGENLVTGGVDAVIRVWDTRRGKLLREVEGHTGCIDWVEFSHDGRLLGSKSNDDTFRLWRCDLWSCVSISTEVKDHRRPVRGLTFTAKPLLATVGSGRSKVSDTEAHIWELNPSILFRSRPSATVTYTSAKVILVGDSGVGKTGLGWRLAHGEFKEHSSTHGQQFWLLDELSYTRQDGAQCDAVLWDLAGQEDYRLIHALFLDDADLALLLFDPSRHEDPLSGVEFWLRQLKGAKRNTASFPIILIAARADRGTPRLTHKEILDYCSKRGITSFLITSAKSGEGIDELTSHMRELIPWEEKPATVTTETFKKIKDFVLDLKENRRRRKVILTPEELRRRLLAASHKSSFSLDEMLTAVRHLSNHGYVTCLKTSRGETRILLSPELLNNLAASFVLEARRNRRGLGALEEEMLLARAYKFPELENLSDSEKDILLDSATALFLEHNVCLRETDPLSGRAYLVFPELINLKTPADEISRPIEDGASYTISGAIENVYASLVVLMGYTQTFTRTSQWQNHARYEVEKGQVCGFRLEEERPGELDFVVFFGADSDAPLRTLFQSLFENFLLRRNLEVRRFEPVICPNGHLLNRAVIRDHLAMNAETAFCNRCGAKITLQTANTPIQLTKQQAVAMEADRRAADLRSRFEQVLFRVKALLAEEKIKVPSCFVSYAWGDAEQEHWVEKVLATDLQKAGITVVLDRWENARIGLSVPRFVERIESCGKVIVVGTTTYRRKYENNEPMGGFVVAAEGDLIGKRMIGTEAQKQSILPVLLQGTEQDSFPPLLQGRIYADFRSRDKYFDVALELLLSVLEIGSREPVAEKLREAMKGGRTFGSMPQLEA